MFLFQTLIPSVVGGASEASSVNGTKSGKTHMGKKLLSACVCLSVCLSVCAQKIPDRWFEGTTRLILTSDRSLDR